MKKISLTIIVLLFSFIIFSKTAEAAPGIVVDPTTAIFNINNAAPGGEYESDLITITNSGTDAEQVQFSVNVTTNPADLSKLLYMKAADEFGNCLANCDFAKNLDTTTEILIGPIGGGSTSKYKFSILFDKNAGNEYQNAQMVFDIAIGYKGQEAVKNDDKKKHGDNDNDNNNNRKRRPGAIFVPAVFQGQGNAPGTGGDVTGPNENVQFAGEEENAGKENGKVAGAEISCQSWPLWVWILILLIYAVMFNYATFFGYKENINKVRWFLPLVFTIAAVIIWYIYDECRAYEWFPIFTVIIGLVSYWYYMYKLRQAVRGIKAEE